MRKDDSIYIDHIKNSLDKITAYISEYDYKSFLESEKTQDAVIRQLEIVGEATKQISKNFRTNNPDIPWADGMRDKLIHNYLDVDLNIVWDTATSDVPFLRALLKNLKV